jgi:hypothetical protein
VASTRDYHAGRADLSSEVVAHGAIAHDIDDVVGVAQEVLAWDGWTSPITTPVEH